jgi:hypothetical protein
LVQPWLASATPGTSRGSILDAYVARIEALVARWPQITAVRVHEELCKEGYVACESTRSLICRTFTDGSCQRHVCGGARARAKL